MGLCYYMLPYDSPLRLPLIEALLRFYTILVDLSLQPNSSSMASGVDCCEGLLEARLADLVENLRED